MINKDQFEKLKSYSNSNAISVYIPTEIIGDYKKNKIRWKNAISKVESQLQANDVQQTEIDRILRPAKELIEKENFWEYQSAGLAGFFNSEYHEIVHLAYQPIPRCEVGPKFVIYPLLPTLLSKERVFILTLSQKDIRFFEAHDHAIFPVKIDDLVPTSLENLELQEKQSSLQHHSASGTQYHGHAATNDKDDVRVEQLFRLVDKGLKPIFKGEQVPLVLAGIGKHQNIYKNITEYKYISDFGINLHPDHSDAVALHSEVLPLFEKIHATTVSEIEDLFGQKQNLNLTAQNLSQIDENVKFKNIDKLLIYGSEKAQFDNEQYFNDLVIGAFDQGAEIRFISQSESEEKGIKAILRFEAETA